MKKPAISSIVFDSWKGRIKDSLDNFRGFGGRRDRTVRLATIRRKRIMSAQILMVHGNPRILISLLIMIGKMTPPILEPEDTIPYTAPRFLLNQLGMQLTAV